MLTDENRLARNAYMRQWKRNNKDKVNAINRRVKAKNPVLYRKINTKSAAKKRAEDPERFLATFNRHRGRNPLRYLITHARCRAKKRGVPFDLIETDIKIPDHCPVLGIKLAWNTGRRASANHSSPSLDRIIPELGYVRGNVRVISNRANHLKNNATAEELVMVANYIRREVDRIHRERAI